MLTRRVSTVLENHVHHSSATGELFVYNIEMASKSCFLELSFPNNTKTALEFCISIPHRGSVLPLQGHFTHHELPFPA